MIPEQMHEAFGQACELVAQARRTFVVAAVESGLMTGEQADERFWRLVPAAFALEQAIFGSDVLATIQQL